MPIKKLITFSLILLSLHSANLLANTILVFGDSLSAGFGLQEHEDWPYLLSQKLEQEKTDFKVVNESISGETTAGGLARFPKALSMHQPSIVILELGANDGLRGQSLKAMKQNLTTMVKLAEKQGCNVLLTGIYIPPNYGKRYTDAFNKVFIDIQQEFNLAFIPFLLDQVAGNDDLMQADGLHPKAKAQPIITETVYKKLKPLLHQSL